MVQTIKFSEFADSGDLSNDNVTVGLEGGANAFFNNPWTFLPPGVTGDRPVPVPEIYYRLRLNTTLQAYEYFNPIILDWIQVSNNTTTNGPFVIYEEDPNLLDAFNLGLLSSGILKQSVSFGVATPAIATLGTDYYGDGMTGTMRSPSGIEDINGNLVVSFISSSNAVNYISLRNAPTGVAPQVVAAGTDLNIPLIAASKGTSPVLLYGGLNGTDALNVASGTMYQHFTLFNFPNTPATRAVTFQDSDGTVAYLSDIPGVVPSALTRVNDTNVTITLGGSPSNALLEPTSITLGWTGILSILRGGTGLSALGTGVQTALGQNVTGTGGIVLGTSPTIAFPYINRITDENTNTILSFSSNPIAIDYLQIRNSAVGGIPVLTVGGLTTDKGILLLTKGTGAVAFSSESNTPFQINSGTSNQHLSTFTFANTANTNNFTFPDASGIIALTQGSGGLKSFQVFTSGAGTYTKPAGITSILVELVGGNAGGGGASAVLLGVSAGGGGGAGGYVRSYIASAAASYSYSVGALGTGGASGTNDGGNGGNTTFSTFTAGGGLGGDGANSGGTSIHPGGAGGTATGGNLINAPGSPGSPGIGLAGHCIGGAGANSYFGGGAIAPWGTSGTGNGIAASANSGGGSGGFAFGIGNAAGGNGSAGRIVVWEFS